MIIYDGQHNNHIDELKNYEVYYDDFNADRVVFEYNFNNRKKMKKIVFQKMGMG